MKFLNVTVPFSFTSECDKCIAEATGCLGAVWSIHINPSVSLEPWWSSPQIHTLHKIWDRITLVSLPAKVDGAFLHLNPLKWCQPRRYWKKSNMTSLHWNPHAERIICYCAKNAKCTKCVLPWCHQQNIQNSVGNYTHSISANMILFVRWVSDYLISFRSMFSMLWIA